jgi:hypothetical protein
MMEMLSDSLNFSGTLFLLWFHWFWLVVAMGLGAWVGWRTAAEKAGQSPAEAAT